MRDDSFDRDLDAIFHDRSPATVDDLRSISNEIQTIIVRLNDIEDAMRDVRHYSKQAAKGIELVTLLALAIVLVSIVRWVFF